MNTLQNVYIIYIYWVTDADPEVLNKENKELKIN